MKNYWKYIHLVFGLALFFLLSTGVNAITIEKENISIQTPEKQTTDNSTGCLNINNDICEDEQMQQTAFARIYLKSVIFISNPRPCELIFQPCFIPWEPPKI